MPLDSEDKLNQVLDIKDPPHSPRTELVVPGEAELDFEYARGNIYGLIEKGQEALEDLTEFARSAQNSRAYEVLGNYIKIMVEINERLVDLQKKKKEVDAPVGPSVVHNNLVLTTAQLQEMLENMKK